ncbi:MAG: amidohydrolase, partial [Ruminococcaceae bacterium]|nr:amidohydrolase [Oscillospiraceae bacterium]
SACQTAAPEKTTCCAGWESCSIDTHIHLYDVFRAGVSWPTRATPKLFRKVLPVDFLQAAAASGVNRAVVVECAKEVENNIWTFELTRYVPEIAAVIGFIDPGSARFPEIYDQYSTYEKFRGIRIGSWTNMPEPGVLDDNLSYMEAKQANVVEILGSWKNLPDLPRLIAAHPDVTFILNHLAGYVIDGGEPEPDYIRFLASVSRLENACMKVSGVIARPDSTPVPLDPPFYEPVLRQVYQAFGEDRCLYGSDWPVITLKGDYAAQYQIIHGFFSQYGKRVLDKAMARNAIRVYKLQEADKEKPAHA